MKEHRGPQQGKHDMPNHSQDGDSANVKILHGCCGRDARQTFYTIENTPQDDPLRNHYRLTAKESDPEEAFQLAFNVCIQGRGASSCVGPKRPHTALTRVTQGNSILVAQIPLNHPWRCLHTSKSVVGCCSRAIALIQPKRKPWSLAY
jgi:hypothetical protein